MLSGLNVEGVPPPKKMLFNRRSRQSSSVKDQFADQGLRILNFRDQRDDMGVEIAVGTLADAEGDMDVERKRVAIR